VDHPLGVAPERVSKTDATDGSVRDRQSPSIVSRRAFLLCAEHVRQLEGESPFDNLMEVKS
jgi:hypothetical protein